MAEAGSTSKTLSHALLYLARNSAAYDKITNEIRSTFPNLESIHQGTQLSSCQYLRACIDETLRLSTLTSSPEWRSVCSDGATIDGEQIPAGCEVAVDLYALHHNPVYFSDPDAFDPHRFMPKTSTSSPEPALKKPKFDFFPSSRANTKFPVSPSSLSPDSFQGMYFPSKESSSAKDNPAFAPFGIGPRSCVGKGFVYLQISLTLARLIWSMEFRALEENRESTTSRLSAWLKASKDAQLLQFKKREAV
ncbi:hypothetical protein ACLMJK_003450 [Lecanora helva]